MLRPKDKSLDGKKATPLVGRSTGFLKDIPANDSFIQSRSFDVCVPPFLVSRLFSTRLGSLGVTCVTLGFNVNPWMGGRPQNVEHMSTQPPENMQREITRSTTQSPWFGGAISYMMRANSRLKVCPQTAVEATHHWGATTREG